MAEGEDWREEDGAVEAGGEVGLGEETGSEESAEALACKKERGMRGRGKYGLEECAEVFEVMVVAEAVAAAEGVGVETVCAKVGGVGGDVGAGESFA